MLEILVVLAPSEMNEFRVGRAGQDLTVTRAKLSIEIGESLISVGQTKVKSFG